MGLKDFMLKLKDQLLAETPAFDPAVFNHPLANKTAWTPKARGGSNFKTRALEKRSSSLLYYKGSRAMFLFGLVFAVFPMLFLIPIFFLNATQGFENGFMYLFMIIPFIFFFVGIGIILNSRRKTFIDKNAGYLYTARKKALHGLQVTPEKGWIKLNDIKALQIIKERVSSKNSSYNSYEINAILSDGSRHNIVDHGKYKAIIADAEVIASFLKIPCWNAVDTTTISPPQVVDAYEDQGSFDGPTSYDAPEEVTQDLDEDYDSLKPRKL